MHPAGSPQARAVLDELGSLIPAKRRAWACVIEITPVGAFRTYGLGVPAADDAQPGHGPGTRAGHAKQGHPMKAPPEEAVTGHPDGGLAAIASRHPAGIGTSRVVFSRSLHAGVKAFHLDLAVDINPFENPRSQRRYR